MSVLKSSAVKLLVIFDLMLLLAALPKPAAAYTDPGTGALLWQTLAASFVGLSFYARRIIRFFKQKRQNGPKLQTSEVRNDR